MYTRKSCSRLAGLRDRPSWLNLGGGKLHIPPLPLSFITVLLLLDMHNHCIFLLPCPSCSRSQGCCTARYSSPKGTAKLQTVLQNTRMSILSPSLFPRASKGQQSSCCCGPVGTVCDCRHFSNPWWTVRFSNGRIPYPLCSYSRYSFLEMEKKNSLSTSERQKILSNWSVVTFMYTSKDQLPHIKHNIHCWYILFPCCSWGMKVLLRTGVRNEKCWDCVGKDGSE